MRSLILLFSLVLFISCDFMRPSLARKVVIDVNGQQMTAENFAEELAFRLRDQDALSAKEPKLVRVMKEKISEEFTVQVLTEAWARENSIVVKADELEAQIQAVQKSYPEDLAFQQALTDEGVSFKKWRERMHDTILQKKVAEKVVEPATAPTDAEAEAFYRENRSQFMTQETAQVRQILVATESDAKSIEDQMKRGKSMTELAKKYSISPEAPQGGMVGWIEKGLTDVFEPAFRMKVWQKSPIIKSSFGYHIFEVTGRKPAKAKAFTEVKNEIKRILMEKKQQSLYLAWLEEQVRKARVFKDQAFIDALKVETKAQ
jgi:peptidyl-prolyl cis-trans isomerase C